VPLVAAEAVKVGRRLVTSAAPYAEQGPAVPPLVAGSHRAVRRLCAGWADAGGRRCFPAADLPFGGWRSPAGEHLREVGLCPPSRRPV
jgi:hypothetical protein